MSNLITLIEKGPCLYRGKGVSEKLILDAEDKLGLEFAPEYHDYLIQFGYAAINGCELTGLGAEGFDGVVEVTMNARRRMNQRLDGFYVVEQTNIDGILIWQDRSGVIYQSVAGDKPIPIAESLGDYLMSNGGDC